MGASSVEKKNCSWSYSLALRQLKSQLSFPGELIPGIGISGKKSSASKYALFIDMELKASGSSIRSLGGKAVILLVQHFGDIVKSCHKNSPNFYFVNHDHFVARIPWH